MEHRLADLELAELLDRFEGRVISPGGAAQLLGVRRQSVYDAEKRGRLRVFRSATDDDGGDGPAWAYIPLDDVYAYARTRRARARHR